MTSEVSSSSSPRAFPNTRWSVVLAAQRSTLESTAALEELCRTYWKPLYTFVLRSGQTPADAEDLTQEFFHRLLEKRWLDSVDREKGKLRTFLVVALKHFMAKEWRRVSAQRRGGDRSHVSFDTTIAESRHAPSGSSLEPDSAFDREWALTLLDLTMNRLREEFEGAGKIDAFEVLKSTLTAGRGAIDYSAVAERLAMNEGAARVAVHRLRKRFREVYREEISRTLTNDADVDEELRHLAAALAGKQDGLSV